MVLNCYESREIIAMVQKVPGPSDLFYNLMFPAANTRVTDADKIAITNYTKGKVCAAPYSNPCGPGVALKRPENAGEIGEFTPPMVHLFDNVIPCDAEEYRIDQMTGEFVATYEDRFEKAISDVAVHHRDSLRERLNLTAAQVLRNGAYTISGDGVATTLIDFQRDARLTLDLVATAGDVWNNSAAKPFELFEALTGVMTEYGAGNGTFDVILTPAAWKWLQKHIDAERVVFGGTARALNRISTDLAAYQYARYLGEYGEFRFWLVNQSACVDGVESALLPDGSIGMVNAAAFNGNRVFGAIKKADGTQERTTAWFRDFYNEKCETRELHLRSRPLLVPANVNASAWVQVVDPAAADAAICYNCP
jgi:Phage major capsid protein E